MTEQLLPFWLQVAAYLVTTFITISALWVTYSAVLRSVQPQIVAYYQPNPDIPSLIDLVIENSGGGQAKMVRLSQPIPIGCFGIDKPDGSGDFIESSGFPALAPGQRYVFTGGQFSGLHAKIGERLLVGFAYRYRDPIGLVLRAQEDVVFSIEHLRRMPSRISADQAIVDALKGPNTTTIQEIRNELRKMNQHLRELIEAQPADRK